MNRRKRWFFSALAVASAFALPVLLSAAPGAQTAEAAENAEARESLPAALPVLDAEIPLVLHTGEGDVSMTMAEYLPLALAGEMPASFEPEALKAQAVALRSYALHYRAERKAVHPEADVCGDAACCAARASEAELRERWGEDYDRYLAKLREAVADTDGEYLVYDDAPILAVFHASSQGRTEDGAALGVSAPYLVSVETPETPEQVGNLLTSVEVSPEELRETVLAACPEASLPPEDPAGWLGETTLNAAGRVATVQLGGAAVSGLALRQMFALRSTDFTLAWDSTAGSFLFRVRGYGHGVGLSQYGANVLAKGGADYLEILAHYYPGARPVMALHEPFSAVPDGAENP